MVLKRIDVFMIIIKMCKNAKNLLGENKIVLFSVFVMAMAGERRK